MDSLTGARGAQVHEVEQDQSWAVAEYEREQHVHEGFCDFRLSFQRVVSRLVLGTLAVHRFERLDLRTQAEVHVHEREHENEERDEHGGVAKHEQVPQEADLFAKKWQSTRDDPNHQRAYRRSFIAQRRPVFHWRSYSDVPIDGEHAQT